MVRVARTWLKAEVFTKSSGAVVLGRHEQCPRDDSLRRLSGPPQGVLEERRAEPLAMGRGIYRQPSEQNDLNRMPGLAFPCALRRLIVAYWPAARL